MKKVISMMLAVTLMLSGITVWAGSNVSETMEKVLVSVKQKVDIPESFTKFTPYTSETGGKANYSFIWQNEDGSACIEVSADDKGRIESYYFFDNSLKSDKKMTTLSKSDILKFAEDFLRKTVPEAFVDENDMLVFDEESWNVSNLTYDLSYKRMRNEIEVKGNSASVRVVVYNDVAYIKNMNLSFAYDAEFEPCDEFADNYEERYKAEFPVELIYRDEYRASRSDNEDEKEVILVYRHKDGNAGYILAATGETVTEDVPDEIFGGSGVENFANKESAADSELKREMLSPKEIEELEKISGLISKADIEKRLKKLPYIGFESKLKLSHYDISEENGEYIISLNYRSEDGERYISAAFEGKTGELRNLYNRKNYVSNTAELTESQKKAAYEKTEQFLKTVAKEKYDECKEVSNEVYGKTVSCNYDRMVAGARYIDDGIYVQFDAENNLITNYRLDFEDDKDFKSLDNVVGENAAYDALLKTAPLKKIYLCTEGVYKVCYTMSRYGIEICATTGEEYNSPFIYQNGRKYQYSDLEGHWAKEKIEKLAEIQIGFNGEKFNPDEPITQYELLKMFAAGVRYRSYLDFDEDELYRILADEGVVTYEEKSPESKVKREDAFVYMIRLDGLEKVAKLQDIFKVEYADQNLISPGKIGYPAILTGMNIICGNGGTLRPRDEITRAEAAVMVYNYMLNSN